MKRPSLKRSKQPPTPQELGAASSEPPSPADPAFAPIAAKPKKPKKVKKPKQAKEPRGPSGIGRAFRRVGHVLALPFRKLAGLKGTPRLVVWGVLAIVVVIVALQLRGGPDDEKLVRETLMRFEQASADKDYQTLCDDLLASEYVRQTASQGLPCEVALKTGLEDVKNPTLEVLSVEVKGDDAAARVRGTAAGQVPGEDVYKLVREDGEWKISPPRPESATP